MKKRAPAFKKFWPGGQMTPEQVKLATGIGQGSAVVASLADSFGSTDRYGKRSGAANVLSSAGSLAATGAQVGGPWGAAIGGAAGIVKGFIDNNAQEQKKRLMQSEEGRQLNTYNDMQFQTRLAGDPNLLRGNKDANYFAFGGDTGDDDKFKAARKTDTIPAGYTQVPGTKYYQRTTTTPAATMVAKPSTGVRSISTGYKSARGMSKPKAISTQSVDYVYMDPPSLPADKPQAAFIGENSFMRTANGSNVAVGKVKVPARNSMGAADPGQLNTGNQNVEFMYYEPNSGKVDNKRGRYQIPATDWNNRGQTSNFVDTAFINKYPVIKANGGQIPNMVNSTDQAQPLSSTAAEFKGPSHENGGIQIPSAQAEVEGGETSQGDYVFSDRLGFAKLHKPLARAIGKIEKKTMSPERITTLKLLHEKVNNLKLVQEFMKKQYNLE